MRGPIGSGPGPLWKFYFFVRFVWDLSGVGRNLNRVVTGARVLEAGPQAFSPGARGGRNEHGKPRGVA